jgi:hypothetical protein
MCLQCAGSCSSEASGCGGMPLPRGRQMLVLDRIHMMGQRQRRVRRKSTCARHTDCSLRQCLQTALQLSARRRWRHSR